MKYDYEHCSPPLRRRCPSRSQPCRRWRPSRQGPERSWSGTCAVEPHLGQGPSWRERWWSRLRQGPVRSPAGSLQGALRQGRQGASRPDESPRCGGLAGQQDRDATGPPARDRGAMQVRAGARAVIPFFLPVLQLRRGSRIATGRRPGSGATGQRRRRRTAVAARRVLG
jgi:hypothetical protein